MLRQHASEKNFTNILRSKLTYMLQKINYMQIDVTASPSTLSTGSCPRRLPLWWWLCSTAVKPRVAEPTHALPA